ncbi:MAG: P-II family nitrogen regulator [Synergistaceae bacterium]|jgi:hypothetical protein|nr:P-II family nitrogen regulator [Synergistaceae bacterium]
MMGEIESFPSLALLVVICDRKESPKIKCVFKGRDTSFNLLTFGKGTASSKILNYLGLGETEKTLLFSAMSAGEAGKVLLDLNEALDLKRPGHGIAFTLPLDGPWETAETFSAENDKNGGDNVTQRYEHTLILAVASRGYSQEVMDAARSVGATGGTIIHARGTAPAGTEKFFGVSIQPEKEIIMILALSEKKQDIMRAIVEKAGVGTPAGTIAFSMPVSGVEGLLSLPGVTGK